MGKDLYNILKIIAFVILNLLFEGVFFYWGNRLLDSLDAFSIFNFIPHNFKENIYDVILTLISIIAFVFFAHYILGGTGFKKIGIKPKIKLRVIFFGLGIVLLLVLPYVIFILPLGYIAVINPNFNAFYMLLGLIFYSITALNEELFFRGFMENELSKIVNTSLIIPISALFFAANHFPNFGYLSNIYTAFSFTNIFLWGIIFSLCYRYSQNIWFPTIVHLGFNSLRMFIGTGDQKYSLFNIRPVSEVAVLIDKYESLIWITINIAVVLLLVSAISKRSKLSIKNHALAQVNVEQLT